MSKNLRITALVVGIVVVCSIAGWLVFLRKSTLIVEAQMVYKMNGPVPVARQQFYLIDQEEVYNDALVKRDEVSKSTLTMITNVLDHSAKGAAAVSNIDVLISTSDVLKHGIIAKAVTDFKGVAKFEALRPGDYWVMGKTETRGGQAGWLIPVKLSAGSNSLILDQNNAILAE